MWAGVAGGAHGAGAGPVGQGIGNGARCGVWPGGYWDVGGAAGWGATAAAAGPGTRAEASRAQAGRGIAEGVVAAPGTCWVAARAHAGSDDTPPWSLTAASIACRSSGRAAVATAPTRAPQKVPPIGSLQEGRADVGRDIGRARDGRGDRYEGRSVGEGRHGLPQPLCAPLAGLVRQGEKVTGFQVQDPGG